MDAFLIALTQYKLNKLPSKLGDAIRFLELVIELDLVYYGESSAITQEHRRVCFKLKQGDITQAIQGVSRKL